MLQEMACIDSWLMAALARALPTFQKSVQQQFKDCRTPTEISSSTRQIQESVPQFDTTLQIERIKQASPHVRVSFMRSLCARGDVQMIEPFLDCGINLDEILDNNLETYIRTAAQYGNLNIIEALLSAGASASSYTRDVPYDRGYVSREIYRLGAVEELFERWWQI